MKKLMSLILSTVAILILSSCNSGAPCYKNRAEKILAEINDPNSDYVVVISHRGDWRNYPENSIPAIESVIRMGVDIMELDVKMTKDSVLVLSHDKTLDRTTTGKGLISDFTYDSLKTFKLKRAHGVAVDSVGVPTLREALMVCKDRILVNVDHAYSYYDEILALTEELGVTGQVLMKGKGSVDQVKSDMARHENNFLYMPIIDINKPKGQALFAEYLEQNEVPMAFEVCWHQSGSEVDDCMAQIRQMGSKIWVNVIWGSLCGGPGNDDDAAYDAKDPGEVYGQYIDMGVSMLQTDRPEMLIRYLRSVGRHD